MIQFRANLLPRCAGTAGSGVPLPSAAGPLFKVTCAKCTSWMAKRRARESEDA